VSLDLEDALTNTPLASFCLRKVECVVVDGTEIVNITTQLTTKLSNARLHLLSGIAAGQTVSHSSQEEVKEGECVDSLVIEERRTQVSSIHQSILVSSILRRGAI
jgi:hypothetical protein